MRKKGIFALILVVLGVVTYNYIYQDHRDISEEKPYFIMTSEEIVSQFSKDSQGSEERYTDKTIQISGTITELNESDLTLDNAVFCQFNNELINLHSMGDKLSIKGRCFGYDDLLELVKLNECSIIKK